jgi:aspartate kinase
MVATSEVSVSLTLDAVHDLGTIRRELSRIAAVDVKTDKAIVTIIGDVRRSSEILEQMFGICREAGVQVQMVSVGASKVNISFIVNDGEAPALVKALHRHFFDEKTGTKGGGKSSAKGAKG